MNENDLTLEKFESAYTALEAAADWESRKLAVIALSNMDYTKFPSVMRWLFCIYPHTFMWLERYCSSNKAVMDMLEWFGLRDPSKGIVTYDRLVEQRPLREMTAQEYESHKDIITRIVAITLEKEGEENLYNLHLAMIRLGLDGSCSNKEFRAKVFSLHRKLTHQLHMNMMEQAIEKIIKENSNNESNG